MAFRIYKASIYVPAPREQAWDFMMSNDEEALALNPMIVKSEMTKHPDGTYDLVQVLRVRLRHVIVERRCVERVRPDHSVETSNATGATSLIATTFRDERGGTRVLFEVSTSFKWWVSPIGRALAIRRYRRGMAALEARLAEHFNTHTL